MMRKLLLVAAAIAMPASASAVTLVATASPAGALMTNCHVSGIITFAPAGLSHNGYVTTATTSTTHVSTQTYTPGTTACTGTGPALSINSSNTKCSATGATTTIPACIGHLTYYGYGSFKAYQATAASGLLTVTRALHFTINGTTYTSRTCAATGCVAIHTCPTSPTYGMESGYEIKGTITTPPTSAATVAIVCIGAITGTSLKVQFGATRPGFTYNLLQGQTAGSTIRIVTATIDPRESSLSIA